MIPEGSYIGKEQMGFIILKSLLGSKRTSTLHL